MEGFVSSFETDPLLLLKERIIKTDTLLDKYACLTRKLNDLEKSHSQAVENEKKAKKDAIKFLGKYCKLAKKNNCLLNKIKILEDDISIKSNELKESQDECAKLESVVQVYKTERKGHQCLKKDRDFLLTTLWKVLKKLEEEPKRGYKSKKMTETVFKKFERELMDLKLEDFRYNKIRNVFKPREKEESGILFSPESQVMGSVESDFTDTDIASELVKSSFEKSDENLVLEKTKNMDPNPRLFDTEHNNDMKTIEVNTLENQHLSLPDLSLGTCQDFEISVDSITQRENVLNDCLKVHTSLNSDFNLCQNGEEEGTSTSMTSVNFTIEEGAISDTEIRSNVQDQSDCSQNYLNLKDKCFPVESEDKLGKEELRKTPEQVRKIYFRRKFQASGHNHEIMKEKISDNCQLTNMSCSANGGGAVSDLTGIFESADIDIFNVSSETISLNTGITLEDIGIIPHDFQYCDIIYDFLKSSNKTSYTNEENFNEEDSYLLFLTADELVGKLRKVNSDTEKTLIRKSYKTISVFDVEDSGSFTPGCVRDKEMEDTCVEFSSDNGNKTDTTEVVNIVRQEKENNAFIEHDEMSRKTEDEDQVDENSKKIYNSRPKEININRNSDRFVDGMININIPNSEFTWQGKDISDEEVYRVLKEYKGLPLLSPLPAEVPKKRRKLSRQQSQKHDKCNISQNVKVTDNLKNMESSKEVLHNKSNGEELVFNAEPDKEKEQKTVDKFKPTDDKVLEEREIEQQSGVEKAVVLPETSIRQLCKLVWKKNLKKLKNLKSCGKICNAHFSCLELMKKLLEIVNHSAIYLRNRTESSHFMNRKMSQRISNSQFCKRKMSPWLVEDVEETNTISKNEPLVNYPKVEDCNSFTQVPMDYHSKHRLDNSTVKSEEMRSQKNVSCNLPTSNQQIEFGLPTSREQEFCGNTSGCNVGREREFDYDIALRHFHSNDIVNNSEEKNDSAEAHDITKNVENTPKPNLENIPEIDGISSNAHENKTDHLEKCDEVKQTETQSGEACSKTDTSVLGLKRTSQIPSRNNLIMEESNRTNGQSLIHKESSNLMKVGISEVSVPSANATSTERHGRYSTESINDSLPIEEVSKEPKSSTLKEKFEEFFGQTESQSECYPSEASGYLTPEKVQKEVNTNGDISDTVAIRKKRRVSAGNSTADRTCNKKMKCEMLSVCGESSGESRPENEVPLNNTFSSEDIGTCNGSNILDSIMSAMTKQSEFFKVESQCKDTEVSGTNYQNICTGQSSQPKNYISSISLHRKISNEYRMKGDNSAFLNLPYYWNVDNDFGKQAVKQEKGSNNYDVNHSEEAKLKYAVQRAIRNFVNLDINSVEEGEDKIKSCIAVLRNATESIIANTIVGEIMANVDEEIKEFERPAPPLTQTQHRIMIILCVFSLSDEQFRRISNQILQIIRSKIFPDNFFWPDDSLEMASRFYAALCKKLNDFKGMWKFCLKVITSMKQRWCIPVLVVLQVWPDIIHNAAYVQNNLLVRTFVNIILHTPKSVGMRRKRQEQKLLAIKHLLINFYNFDVNSTIEDFTEKLWESVVNNMPGSVDAFVLICKCRPWSWTRKNAIAKLLETLESWMKGEVPDVMVSKVLEILQQITTIFPNANSGETSPVTDVTSVLSQVLRTERLNPISKEKIIRILCDFCHCSGVRDVLLQFSEKLSTSEPLYATIQKALSTRKSKCKRSCKKENTKMVRGQRRKIKPKKKKKNSCRQKSGLDNVETGK